MLLKFFYDQANKKYRCSLIEEKKFSNVKIEDAKKIIKSTKFDKIKIEGKTIKAYKENLKVIIDDIDKSTITFDLLKNNYKLVKKQLPLRTNKNISTVEEYPVSPIEYDKIMALNEEAPIIICNKVEEQIEEEPIIEEIKNTVEISYGTALDTVTYQGAYKMHHDSVAKACETWGLDENIIMAMLTQESAGLKENLMQIKYSAFEGDKLTSYNYKLNKKQTYFFTDDPNYVTNNKYIVVRSSDLSNKDMNIFLGALITRVNIDRYDNPFAGILGYNQGSGNMEKIFKQTYLSTGLTKEEQISNNNYIFSNYAYASKKGDKDYLSNVFRYYNSDKIVNKKIVDGQIQEYIVYLSEPTIELSKTY